MSKYRVYGAVTGTKYLGIVEAESAEDAKEKGFELDSAYISLCHECASEIEEPNILEIHVQKVTDEEK